MSHCEQIFREFNKIAINQDWWKNLPREEQLKYIKQHRGTKLRPTALVSHETKHTINVINSLPKRWKNTLVRGHGVGQNSELIQLPDALRGKQMRDAFKEPDVAAIVAFKSGTPINQLQPEFMIKPSYEENKYNAEVMMDAEGNPFNEPKSIYKEKYRRRRGRGYNERIHDLRMKAIIDNLPDRVYTVYAIKSDPKRQEKIQARRGEKEVSIRRSVENTLIENEIKPIYDYYSQKLQENLEILRDAAVPTFDALVQKKRYSKLPGEKKMQEAIDNVKHARDKLSSLSSAIDSVKYEHLPAVGSPIVPQEGWNRNKAKKFLEKIKELKSQFKNEYNYVYKQKIDDAITGLSRDIVSSKKRNENLLDTVDALKSIKRRDLAREAIQIFNDATNVNVNDEAAVSDIKERQSNLIKLITAARYDYDTDE